MRIVLGAFLLLVSAPRVAAQPAGVQADPELTAGARLVTGLSQATSIRFDPAGLMYIADPGRHIIDIRGLDGTAVSVIGGPGLGGQQFDAPMDVDPTNGLLIAVADAGNSRIARFSSRHQLLESIPLYGSSREGIEQSASVVGDDDPDDMTPGRPVAVVLNESNETYAIDETRGVVAKWDNSRRIVALIGDGPGVGRLIRPVDLEVIGDQLYVADAEAKSVVVFDLFGGVVMEIGGGRLADIVGLGTRGKDLWVAYGRRLAVYSQDGTLQARFRLPAGATDVADVAVSDRHIHLLTATTVLRWSLDSSGRPPTVD